MNWFWFALAAACWQFDITATRVARRMHRTLGEWHQKLGKVLDNE